MDEKLAAVSNATDPNRGAVSKLGHKLLYYHGASDPLIPRRMVSIISRPWKRRRRSLGKNNASTQDLLRAFLVPGLLSLRRRP